MSLTRLAYPLVAAVFFGAGAYVWKVKNTGTLAAALSQGPIEDEPMLPPSLPGAASIVAEIAGDKITQADVEWEYGLVTAGIKDKEELTPIPDLGPRLEKELTPLRKALVANLIERKLLFKFIQEDKEFTFDEPGRYAQCMEELQETLRKAPELSVGREAKTRLRNRLCERSILDQYLKERLFKSIQITETEVVEYFKNHVAEFKKPERVEIRQVLLPTESEAKKVRNRINAQNFADIARSQSIAPEAADGGHLGPFSKASIPAIYEVAAQMRKGDISDILKSPYGYHIVMLLDKLPRVDLSLEQARPRIETAIRRKKEEELYSAWVNKALASITVSTPQPLW